MRQRDFRTFLESILEPSWAPKGGGKGAQVGAKTDQNRRRKRRCNKRVFKIVLGRSWSRLGAILARFVGGWRRQNNAPVLAGVVFREKSLFRIKIVILTLLGRTWEPLGPIRTFLASILESSWAPKREANGAQVGAKTEQNRRRKRRCKKKLLKIVFGRSWSRLGAILGPSWPNLRPSWDDLGASGG